MQKAFFSASPNIYMYANCICLMAMILNKIAERLYVRVSDFRVITCARKNAAFYGKKLNLFIFKFDFLN